MKGRISAALAGAFVSLIVSVVAFTGGPAIETQGEAVVAGGFNTATNGTTLNNSNADPFCFTGANFGFLGCGDVGVRGEGTIYGVEGGGPVGVFGSGDIGGIGVRGLGETGVKGQAIDDSGIGIVANGGVDGLVATGTENAVEAQGGTFGVFATGTDYGVYASAPNHGVYGQATASGGVGVQAVATTNGATALSVQGKAKFSRSGIVTIAAGTASKAVTLTGVTTSSMILATAQTNAAVYVKSATPASGSFTIRLTGNAPSSGVKVAYFVLN
jgi:hypothetical protein